MSIQKKVKKSLLEGKTIEVAGMTLHKITAGSFTLCELLDLAVVKGIETKFQQSEMLMFLYIHFVGSKEARRLVFDESEGKDSNGRSMAFINAYMDWADELPMSSYAKLGEGVTLMLKDGFEGAIETTGEKQEGNAKKVA